MMQLTSKIKREGSLGTLEEEVGVATKTIRNAIEDGMSPKTKEIIFSIRGDLPKKTITAISKSKRMKENISKEE